MEVRGRKSNIYSGKCSNIPSTAKYPRFRSDNDKHVDDDDDGGKIVTKWIKIASD